MLNCNQQVDDLRQLLGERDIEVRDLAYKDLLPGPNPSSTICTTSTARTISLNNTCDNYWVLNHYKQYWGAISKKEEHDKHYYIQMIDSIDPVAILQQEGQEKENEQGRRHHRRDITTTKSRRDLSIPYNSGSSSGDSNGSSKRPPRTTTMALAGGE